MTAKKTKTQTTAITKAKAKKAAAPKPAEAPVEASGASKLSALDAAAKVLGEAGTSMSCQELIGAMAAKVYWSSPAGKTPAATLYSALTREIATKGERSRFAKAGPGRFTLNASTA